MDVLCLVISLYFLVSSMHKKNTFVSILWTITTIMWLRIVFIQ